MKKKRLNKNLKAVMETLYFHMVFLKASGYSPFLKVVYEFNNR